MNKILFYARIYWEMHWLHNVVKAMDGEVWTEDEGVKNYCNHHGIRLAPQKDSYKILVTCIYHMGQNWDMINYYKNTGGKVVMLQHAWDSAIHLRDKFWNFETDRFSYYCVGSLQDYDWLKEKYGEKIVLTGLPKLDDLYKIKNEETDYQSVYDKLGKDNFYLSMLAYDSVHGTSIERKYREFLPQQSQIPIIYKIHPGGNYATTRQCLNDTNFNHLQLIDDSRLDILDTYRILKSSRGVVCIESFFAIEASLLGKPVVLYGYEDLTNDFWNREENSRQKERLSMGISSGLNTPEYKEEQRQYETMYLFDGQSTKRVVDFLLSL